VLVNIRAQVTTCDTSKHTAYKIPIPKLTADADADIQEQTRSTLAKVDELLAEAGSDKEHLLSATIYLRDIANHFALMNEVWNAWVPEGHAPARACVQAHMARPALLVEISIVAAVAT